jgi:hypothetical protein
MTVQVPSSEAEGWRFPMTPAIRSRNGMRANSFQFL